ncbi:MAG: J domain-containing protein [Sandaracinaceae bacterium]|jgi:hypothetical protein|nr:J domain-containing protein [Sandaracinaceae bacterium]
MGEAKISREELKVACDLVFGVGIIAPDELRCKVTPVVLKAIYRRRVREVHPDRASALGVSSATLHELFRKMQSAFELVQRVVVEGVAVSGDPTPARFRFAEFLVRTGRISRDTMVEAVRWQRRQRPSVGRLAVEAGFMTDDQVWEVLHERRKSHAFAERFVEFACKRGYLSQMQASAVVAKQERMHRRIGEYFIEQRLFDADTIAAFAVEQTRFASA